MKNWLLMAYGGLMNKRQRKKNWKKKWAGVKLNWGAAAIHDFNYHTRFMGSWVTLTSLPVGFGVPGGLGPKLDYGPSTIIKNGLGL
jgi:hypothetical protein